MLRKYLGKMNLIITKVLGGWERDEMAILMQKETRLKNEKAISSSQWLILTDQIIPGANTHMAIVVTRIRTTQ